MPWRRQDLWMENIREEWIGAYWTIYPPIGPKNGLILADVTDLSWKSACNERVATCGFDHRLPPSSTSSSNFTHRAVSRHSSTSPLRHNSPISVNTAGASFCSPKRNIIRVPGAKFAEIFWAIQWWILHGIYPNPPYLVEAPAVPWFPAAQGIPDSGKVDVFEWIDALLRPDECP